MDQPRVLEVNCRRGPCVRHPAHMILAGQQQKDAKARTVLSGQLQPFQTTSSGPAAAAPIARAAVTPVRQKQAQFSVDRVATEAECLRPGRHPQSHGRTRPSTDDATPSGWRNPAGGHTRRQVQAFPTALHPPGGSAPSQRRAGQSRPQGDSGWALPQPRVNRPGGQAISRPRPETGRKTNQPHGRG